MSEDDQLALDVTPPPANVGAERVRALAGTLAGFAWPGYGRWERVPKRLRERALLEAEAVLARLEMWSE